MIQRTSKSLSQRPLMTLFLGLALGGAMVGCGSDQEADPDPSPAESTTSSPSSPETQSPETESPESSAPPTPETPELEVGIVSSKGGRGHGREHHGDRGGHRAEHGSGLHAVVAQAGASGDESRRGKLIIASNGCWHLTSRSGPPTLLVFPEDVRIEDQRKPAVAFEGTTYPVGSRLDLTGESLQLSPRQASQAKPCVARGEVFRIADLK